MDDLYVLSSELEKRDIVRCEKCGEYMSDLEYQTHQCSTMGGDGVIEDNRIDEAMDRVYRFKLPSIEERNAVATNYLLRKAYPYIKPIRHDIELFIIRGRDGY